MYLTEIFFKNVASEKIAEQMPVINQLIEQWRYNGQIIGREIPLFFAKQKNDNGLAIRVICPEQQSLLAEYNNKEVEYSIITAEEYGLILDSFHIIADDMNSDTTYKGILPHWQILYTTYLQSCSPLHNGDNLAPIPLYKQLKNIPHLSQDVIKWQENWQACDQLQMNGSVLEQQALAEISNTDSNLFKHGYYLTKAIEQYTNIPTYYYLYRVGGQSLNMEKTRRCPICTRKWALPYPHLELFHFKCDHCRLVSNLSWNWQ